MSKSKKITIKVRNSELDALEDILTVDFQGNTSREEKCRKKALRIWSRLVKEFDRPKRKTIKILK